MVDGAKRCWNILLWQPTSQEGPSRCRRFARWWVPPFRNLGHRAPPSPVGAAPAHCDRVSSPSHDVPGVDTGPKHSVQYRRITETKDKLNVNLLWCQRQRRFITERLDGRLDCTRNGEKVWLFTCPIWIEHFRFDRSVLLLKILSLNVPYSPIAASPSSQMLLCHFWNYSTKFIRFTFITSSSARLAGLILNICQIIRSGHSLSLQHFLELLWFQSNNFDFYHTFKFT